MKLIKILNPENVSEDEAAKFIVRNAARAIVYDHNGNIGILRVSKYNYHKLPGGGVEEGENIKNALKRECLEELGCDIEVCGEVGQVLEYRKNISLKQISYCYLAKMIGINGNPSFTQEELKSGFQILWLPVEKAIELLASDSPVDYEGIFITARDKAFLEAVKTN